MIVDFIKRRFSAAARENLLRQRKAADTAAREHCRAIVTSPIGINLFAIGVTDADCHVIRAMQRYNRWLENNRVRFPDVTPQPRYVTRTSKGWLVNDECVPGYGYLSIGAGKPFASFMKEACRNYLRMQAVSVKQPQLLQRVIA